MGNPVVWQTGTNAPVEFAAFMLSTLRFLTNYRKTAILTLKTVRSLNTLRAYCITVTYYHMKRYDSGTICSRALKI
jgi:hypothetical protein